MKTETPRTDAVAIPGDQPVTSDYSALEILARQLERELNDAQAWERSWAKSANEADERLKAELEIREKLVAALKAIQQWELPSTGEKWDDGTPMSYGAAFGSSGERDYMRGIARAALAKLEASP